eukprot:4276049-Amphidinium_carterae.2
MLKPPVRQTDKERSFSNTAAHYALRITQVVQRKKCVFALLLHLRCCAFELLHVAVERCYMTRQSTQNLSGLGAQLLLGDFR